MSEATAPTAPSPATQTTAPAPNTAPATAATTSPPAPAQPDPKAAEKDATAARLRAHEERLRREREAVKAQAKELETAKSRAAEYERIRALAKTDPKAAAEALELSFDALTQAHLRGKVDPAVAELRKKTEALERELAASKAEREQRQGREVEAHWSGVMDALSEISTGEVHSLLGAEIAADRAHVQSVIQAIAQQRPEMTIAEVATLYERHLATQLDRMLATPAGRARLAREAQAAQSTSASTTAKPSAAVAQQDPRAQGGATKGAEDGPRSLDNGLAAGRSRSDATPRVSAARARDMAETEKLQRALAALPSKP